MPVFFLLLYKRSTSPIWPVLAGMALALPAPTLGFALLVAINPNAPDSLTEILGRVGADILRPNMFAVAAGGMGGVVFWLLARPGRWIDGSRRPGD